MIAGRAAVAIKMLCAIAAVASGQLVQHGESQADPRAVVSVDGQGVVVREPDGRSTTVGWHLVKQVDGTWASEHPEFGELADLAWRGWSRSQRGDYSLAEPALERVVEILGDDPGATSAAALVALMECQLERGAQAAALVSWGRLRAMPAAAREGGLSSAIDRATLLCPQLPPVFMESPSLALVVDRLAADEVVGWYRVAAAHELGQVLNRPTATAVGREPEPDALLVRSIVVARVGDPLERREARAVLESFIAREPGGWVEAWCRAGLGRSLANEPNRESALRGVVQLLHVPVRFAEQLPELASTCQAEAALALARMGDQAGAEALARDLARRWPGSAAAGDARIRRLLDRPARNATSNERAAARQETSL